MAPKRVEKSMSIGIVSVDINKVPIALERKIESKEKHNIESSEVEVRRRKVVIVTSSGNGHFGVSSGGLRPSGSGDPQSQLPELAVTNFEFFLFTISF